MSLICAHCVSRRGGYVGYIRKALEKGYLEHPRSACCTEGMIEFLFFVSDSVCVGCCLFLSTGSYHVRMQIHPTLKKSQFAPRWHMTNVPERHA